MAAFQRRYILVKRFEIPDPLLPSTHGAATIATIRLPVSTFRSTVAHPLIPSSPLPLFPSSPLPLFPSSPLPLFLPTASFIPLSTPCLAWNCKQTIPADCRVIHNGGSFHKSLKPCDLQSVVQSRICGFTAPRAVDRGLRKTFFIDFFHPSGWKASVDRPASFVVTWQLGIGTI